MTDKKATVFDDIAAELLQAQANHAPINSAHEAYAVILEELDEFWEWVRSKRAVRNRALMRKELIQVAAMATRAILDLGLEPEPAE